MKGSTIKSRILDAASRLFYEQGYSLTGINQIIEEADIAKSSLYSHFPSKRAILSAYIQNAEDIWFVKLEEFLAPIEDPKSRLLALFDFRLDNQIKTDFGNYLFIKIGAELRREDLKGLELVSHQKDRLRRYIRNLMQYIDFDQPQKLSPEMLSEALFLMLEGATVSASVQKDVSAIKNAKAIAENLLA